MDDIAYKVLTEAKFTALRADDFHGAPVDVQDGFIHLSTAAQLDETVKKHFAGQTALVIVAIDLKPLGNQIRWEISRNGALFPHLHSRLKAEHILAACPAEADADGKLKLPTAQPTSLKTQPRPGPLGADT